MERTLLLLVTHRGLSDETRACIERLRCPNKIEVRGLANVCKARSYAFDQAVAHLDGTDVDTVLCLDDDMTFDVAAVARLVELSRRTGELVSGAAVTRDGVLAARPWNDGRWLTGLACMAIPRARLDALAAELEPVGTIRPWCLTGAHPEIPGEWVGEDLWFCLRFGGALLAPVAIGHLKFMPLVPDEDTLARIDWALGPI